MINSVHYFSENDISLHFKANTPHTKMLTANCHVIYNRENLKCFNCVKTHPSHSSLFMTESKMSLSIENRNYRV